jgi:hypothetical protein
MNIIEPLENEPATAEAGKSDTAKNYDADDTESEFAPWDE